MLKLICFTVAEETMSLKEPHALQSVRSLLPIALFPVTLRHEGCHIGLETIRMIQSHRAHLYIPDLVITV